MKKDFDSRVIVDRLWHIHRDEWDAASMQRLSALVGSNEICADASFNLSCYLLALEGREDKLLSVWHERDQPGFTLSKSFTVMECLGHLRSTNRSFIEDTVRMVAEAGLFGARYEAMIALARIGHASWPDAAAVIRDKIYDSEPWIIAFRDCALERIESEDELWERCSDCTYGLVLEHKPCDKCLGIGFVRRADPA